MATFAIFIEPYGDLKEFIAEWKCRVESVLPGQPYCCHPPHCTLIVTDMSPVKDWLGTLAAEVNVLLPFDVAVRETIIFYDDIMTGGHSIALKAEQSQSLYDLQRTVGNALQSCIYTSEGKLKDAFKTEPYKSSYDRYGFAFIGDHWIPHFSIASIKTQRDNPLMLEFKDVCLNYQFTVYDVSVWRVRDDTHVKIADLCLKGGLT